MQLSPLVALLVAVMLRAGAGWGGCIVALLKDTDAIAFIAQLRDGYYRKALAAGQLDDSRLAAAIFMTKPSHGASCIRC